MKLPKLPLAGTLLLSYTLYSTFVPVSIAHSIILLSLAAFAGFNLYIESHQLPSTEKKIEDLRLELVKQMSEQKEIYEAKLQELKDEQTRQSIARANSTSASSTPKKAPIQF